MSGFGSQPAGRSPFGIGVPRVPDEMPGRVYRDDRTGDALHARRIDAKTRDYVYDEHGRALGMSGVLQQVQLAIGTELGSAVMRELGQELSAIDVITPNLERRIETTLTEAVAHLIAARLIRVLGVTMFKAGPDDGLPAGAVHTRFRFVDLTTNEPHTIEVGR